MNKIKQYLNSDAITCSWQGAVPQLSAADWEKSPACPGISSLSVCQKCQAGLSASESGADVPNVRDVYLHDIGKRQQEVTVSILHQTSCDKG